MKCPVYDLPCGAFFLFFAYCWYNKIMDIDYNEKDWATPCPKYDCRKAACECGLKYVNIPASLGDDSEGSDVAPKNGAYCNALVIYEANNHVYIYTKEGIPTLIDVDASDISTLEQEVRKAQRDIVEFREDIDRFAYFFDTVADMRSSTQLSSGDYARTLGYYEKGDGGGAYYKVSSVQPSGYYETLGNMLYAELIVGDIKNVKQFGVKADGTTDNSAKLNTILGYGFDSLYFPNGTYLINSRLTIDNCKDISGQSVQGTVIKAPNGFVTWTQNNNYRTFSNMAINGVTKTDSNIGIEGAFSFSKMENLRILGYHIAIKPLYGTWINNFDYVAITYCDNGIYNASISAFNDNTFINCAFQHITNECVNASGDVNDFVGCDFEYSHYCFGRVGRLLNIDGCYIEGNDRILNINGASFLADVTIKNSWLCANTSFNNGWVACFYTSDNVDTQTASLLISDCNIQNKTKDTAKLFSFQESSGTKSYWGVSLSNNSYFDITSTHTYQPYYVDLFDFTNATSYGKTSNPITFTCDIPIYKFDGIYAFRKSLGNKRAALVNSQMMELKGHYSVEKNSGAITITPEYKFVNIYPQQNNIPVMVKFTDNTIDFARMSVDGNNFYIYPNYNGRTTSEIIFDCSYIRQ